MKTPLSQTPPHPSGVSQVEIVILIPEHDTPVPLHNPRIQDAHQLRLWFVSLVAQQKPGLIADSWLRTRSVELQFQIRIRQSVLRELHLAGKSRLEIFAEQ